MAHENWTPEALEELHNAEENMNETLANPASSYTEMCRAIDRFFEAW